ncbi:MAG: hypothetical protein ATN35_11175 [Epulopiscium sp. Nele67-Bin004]|nr:MAG: hypothetical protein ATN35_11175 [Epulopiscium sp. Nele67-Bin004]
MKKRINKLIAVLGISALFNFSILASYTDVSTSHWAYESIMYMQQNGYMVGTSSGEFFPNQTVNYFEMCEILAKVAGYEDEQINPDMDETLKQQIRDNYEQQISKIEVYSNKYVSWSVIANQEIAYLLGKGYLLESELENFMVADANGNMVRATVKKEDLAVILVRMLHKEVTAQNDYVEGAFSDEDKIEEYKRPHVAYLKSIGIIQGDGNGEFGAGTNVTRATMAKMTADVAELMELDNPPTNSENAALNDATGEMINNAIISKMLNKSNTEKYVLVEFEDGNTSFYSMSNAITILDEDSNVIDVDNLSIGTKVDIIVELIGSSEYITTMKVLSGTTVDDEAIPDGVLSRHQGEVTRVERTGSVTIQTADETLTYLVNDKASINLIDEKGDFFDIEVGDNVIIYVQNSYIMAVDIDKYAYPDEDSVHTVNSLYVQSILKTRDEYLLAVRDGSDIEIYSVSFDAIITRDGEPSSMTSLKVGDRLSLEVENDIVISATAVSEQLQVTGTLQAIAIKYEPEITILVDGEEKTFIVTQNSSLYDDEINQVIGVMDLELYSTVTITADSSEIKTLEVDSYPRALRYKGVIQSVSKSGDSIEVLVEYDMLTDTSMFMKDISIPTTTNVIIHGRESIRSRLEAGMEVLITYEAYADMVPKEVFVLD